MERRLSNDFVMSIYLAVHSALSLAVNSAMTTHRLQWKTSRVPLSSVSLSTIGTDSLFHSENTHWASITHLAFALGTEYEKNQTHFCSFSMNLTQLGNKTSTRCVFQLRLECSAKVPSTNSSWVSRAAVVSKRQGEQWCKKWKRRLPGKCLVTEIPQSTGCGEQRGGDVLMRGKFGRRRKNWVLSYSAALDTEQLIFLPGTLS